VPGRRLPDRHSHPARCRAVTWPTTGAFVIGRYLYDNAPLAGSQTATGIHAPGAFNIGRYKYLDGYAGNFAGLIDDVRVYVGGITDAARIKAIMNGG
jgi:hypothetical protein